MGGTVSEQRESSQHTLSLQSVKIENNTLTIDTYAPCNTAATVYWSADVYYAE